MLSTEGCTVASGSKYVHNTMDHSFPRKNRPNSVGQFEGKFHGLPRQSSKFYASLHFTVLGKLCYL